MRNLRLLQHSASPPIGGVESPPAPFAAAGFCCTSVDSERGVLHAVTQDGELLSWDAEREQLKSRIDLVDDGAAFPMAGAPPTGSIAGMQYLQLDEAVCVAYANGDLMLCTLDGSDVECVGSFPVGIKVMSWAPDQEIFALITSAGDLLVMTREFDILSEAPIETADFGVAAPVNLGWGQKETQFQGKAGKLSTQPKMLTAEVPADDDMPRISWRGDGEYFVTSSKHDGARRLRMWDRNAILQSTSEKVDGLEQSLAWRPSGNLIAGTQRLPHRHDVVFFERNGLRHGEFTLPFAQGEVQVLELGWNCDSSILAIWISPLPTAGQEAGENPMTYLQLWTCSNYHWYLKQEYQFGTAGWEKLAAFEWDPEEPCRLFATAVTGEVHNLMHGRAVDGVGGLEATNQGTTAVVDGSRLLLTHFRKECVPPPMSSAEISLTKVLGKRRLVRHVAFLPARNQGDGGAAETVSAAVLTTNQELVLLRIPIGEGEPDLLGSFDIGAAIAAKVSRSWSYVRQACWVSLDSGVSTVLVVLGERGKLCDTLVKVTVTHCGEADTCEVSDVVCTELPERVVRLQPNERFPNSRTIAAVGLASGVVLSCFGSVSGALTTAVWTGYHDSASISACSQLGIVAMDVPAADADAAPDDMLGMMDLSDSGGEDNASDADEAPLRQAASGLVLTAAESLLLVALSSTGQLYLNGRLLLSNCNSFALHDAYLVFATNEHACWFVRTSAGVDAAFAQFAANGTDLQGSSARAVERGARLVAVIPRGVRVIMQMPRGNLEMIFPRPLLLVALRAALEAKAYRRAFTLARKHRLSLNLICDFDLTVFSENIGPFIRALDKAASLNLFLSDLSDEDHARHFEDIAAGASIAAPPRTAGKRDTLCDLVRAELFRMNDPKFRLSIVHSYLCKSMPEYDPMLGYIQTIRTISGEAADAALNHAGVVLKDPELLYNAALGTYDFDLVVMVAQVLQKDPKEYLPFLDELSEFPVQERKYRIDLHLKRFDRALRNLADAGDEHFQTCLDLLVEHSLFKDGLAIYKEKAAEQYVAVQAASARNLCKAGKYREAGLLFNACGKQKDALESFQSGLEWQWAITMSAELQMDETQRHDVMLGLAQRLQGARRFQEAATIAETYLNDPELTIEVQICGKSWMEALMMAQRTNRKDLIETHLKDGVVAEADAILAGFGDAEGAQMHSFKRHADRLALVRTEKYARSLEMLDPDFEDNPESDLYSDTSSRASTKSSRSRGSSRSRSSKGSNSSHGSKNSRMTHRSRRRNDAKKTSLREGGAFEEVALLEALRLIVARAQATATALPALCSVLYFFGMPAKAAEVERLLTELQDVIWARHGDIWSTRNLLSSVIGTAAEQQQQQAVAGGPNLTANARAASFVGDDPEVDPSLRHPLENLLSTFSKVKIDEVEVDVPAPPPEKPADRATKPWESMFMALL